MTPPAQPRAASSKAGPHIALLGADHGLPVAWNATGPVSRARFLAHVHAQARRLPEGRYVINLCEDRYRFLVLYGAALARGQTCLLPHNRTEHAAADLLRRYRPAHALGDADVTLAGDTGAGLPVPAIPSRHVAAIVFTSGSTGDPRPHAKCWGGLARGAALVQARYGIAPRPGTLLVATVAPQHMFGLEASIMLPLICGIPLHAARPFFPADLHAILAAAPEHRILITTPYHLGVFVQAGLEWPPVELIVSATAPMDAELARRAEQVFGGRVMEIFGSSETGAIASRRTAHEELWTLYDGLRLTGGKGRWRLEGGHLPEPVTLSDRLERHGQGRFALLGRDADLVKVGGKRCSLADLTRALCAVPGVTEGVFIAPAAGTGAAPEGRVARLAALAVAPGQTAPAILRALAQRIDPAFLPRPLHLVERLPRTETGKLARAELLALLERLEDKR
jgi:acyl-coenzyme A synthetase/AMP-(fatty) acid ligase